MSILLNVVLVVSALTEILAAASLIGGPGGISAAGTGEQWSMHYGFAALAIASLSVWVWPHRRHLPTLTTALGVLLTFHSGVCVSLAMAGDQAAGMVIHAVLAALLVVLFVRRQHLAD
ncbi:MAG: hypothetical protein AAF993_02555 [Pseudomonadota bacterium]